MDQNGLASFDSHNPTSNWLSSFAFRSLREVEGPPHAFDTGLVGCVLFLVALYSPSLLYLGRVIVHS